MRFVRQILVFLFVVSLFFTVAIAGGSDDNTVIVKLYDKNSEEISPSRYQVEFIGYFDYNNFFFGDLGLPYTPDMDFDTVFEDAFGDVIPGVSDMITLGKVWLVSAPEETAIAKVRHIRDDWNNYLDRSGTFTRKKPDADGFYTLDMTAMQNSDFTIFTRAGNNQYYKYVYYDDDKIPSENVMGDYVGLCTMEIVEGYEVSIVIVQTTKSAQNVDKNELEAAIDSVTGNNADNWHKTGDRYNGKPDDTILSNAVPNGFWAVITASNGPLQIAQNISTDTGIPQHIVDTATLNLNTAIAKLIPATQVNATALYEALEGYKNQSKLADMSIYTSSSVSAFEAARSAAQAELDALFDANGDATAYNTASNQDKVDAVIAPMAEAFAGLYEKSKLPLYYEYIDAINVLDRYLTGVSPNESDYESSSWAAFAAARNAANAYVADASALSDGPTKSFADQAQEKYSNLWLSYFRDLKSKDSSITVHLRVVDNQGAYMPVGALTDAATAVYDSEVTLSAGHKISDLTSAAGLNFGYTNAPDINPQLYYFVNGVHV